MVPSHALVAIPGNAGRTTRNADAIKGHGTPRAAVRAHHTHGECQRVTRVGTTQARRSEWRATSTRGGEAEENSSGRWLSFAKMCFRFREVVPNPRRCSLVRTRLNMRHILTHRMHRVAAATFAPRPPAVHPASPRGGRGRLACALRSTSKNMPLSSSVDCDTAPAGATRRSFALHHPSSHAALVAQGMDVRVIHMVRHAQGTHNVEVDGIGLKHPVNHDARLTDFGKNQCHAFSQSEPCVKITPGVELVVTSPLTRCCETALLCFPSLVMKDTVPFVAHASVRETVNFRCDAHREKTVLAAEFDRIAFDVDGTNVSNEDSLWQRYEDIVNSSGDTLNRGQNSKHDTALQRATDDSATRRTASDKSDHRESCDLVSVADRGRDFFAWLGTRSEKTIAVSSHSAFLRCLFSWGHVGGVRDAPPQYLDHVSGRFDEKDNSNPVVTYGDDLEFEAFMRNDWANCELRTFLVVC